MTQNKQKGFSLIEILIVITLIALVVIIAMPNVSSFFQVSLGAATRDLAVISKETFHTSLITGRVFRIVYDLKKSEYWVESTLSATLLDTKESRERLEKRKKVVAEATGAAFSMDGNISKKKRRLPTGVFFEDVVTDKDSKPQKEGVVMQHFFPYSLAEQVIVHLKDSANHRATLVISPTNGNTDFYAYYVDPKDVFGK
jgi:prepilin-type N-terminal cleavage/methylation domain-containing protein